MNFDELVQLVELPGFWRFSAFVELNSTVQQFWCPSASWYHHRFRLTPTKDLFAAHSGLPSPPSLLLHRPAPADAESILR